MNVLSRIREFLYRNILVPLSVISFRVLDSLNITFLTDYSEKSNEEVVSSYSLTTYKIMASDNVRNNYYRKALRRLVEGKKVVEIGPGPTLPLTRIAVEEGAEEVVAIEKNEMAYNEAKKYVNSSSYDNLFLDKGDSKEKEFQGKFELFLQEVIGNIGSSEGLVRIKNDANGRYLKDECTYVPKKVTTFLVPVSPFITNINRLLTNSINNGLNIERKGIYKVHNFHSREYFLSEPCIFEEIEMKGKTDELLENSFSFEINKTSFFEGFLLFMRIDFGEGDVLDTFEENTVWSFPFIKIFDEPVKMEEGEVLEGKVISDLGDGCPSYTLKFKIKGKEKKFSWEGL